MVRVWVGVDLVRILVEVETLYVLELARRERCHLSLDASDGDLARAVDERGEELDQVRHGLVHLVRVGLGLGLGLGLGVWAWVWVWVWAWVWV